MKKLVFLCSILFALAISQPVFAEWEIDWDYSSSDSVCFTTINTNRGAAWLKIDSTLNAEGFAIYLEVQNVRLSTGNTKVEYKFGDKNAQKFVVGKKSGDKHLLIFGSARNHKNVVKFIEELKNNSQLSITFDDVIDDTYVFIFDVNGLQEAFDEAFSHTTNED